MEVGTEDRGLNELGRLLKIKAGRDIKAAKLL